MDAMTIALVLLWLVVIVLGVVVFALARQIGVLFERVAPMGALITEGGPKVGDAAVPMSVLTLSGETLEIGAPRPRSILIFFLSPTCPVCKKLLPVLKSAARSERDWLDVVLASDGERPKHETFVRQQNLEMFPYVLSADLGMSYRVNRLPFALVIDPGGIVRSKGLVNNREQLESLFNAKEMGVQSIQRYLDVAPAHHG
jgi:methylamine dehydrogenase accessory protein MauD